MQVSTSTRSWRAAGTEAGASVPEMQLMSLNINGVHRPSKRNHLLAMHMQHSWGILMLADTRVHDTRELSNLNRLWKCKDGFWSKGTPNVGGTAVLFYKQVLVKDTYHDCGGRFTRVDFVWEGETITVLCLYAPANHSERKALFADTLFPYLQRNNPPAESFLIGGDFNFVENPSLDRTSPNAGGIAGLTEWAELSESFELQDAFRKFHMIQKGRHTPSFLPLIRCKRGSIEFTVLKILCLYSKHANMFAL
jgi:exonuclease III